MTTCIDLKELRSSWAPQGIPKGEPASSRGDSSDSTVSGSMNPGGASGSHLHAMAITPKLLASLGSEASSGWLGACTTVGHPFWGSFFTWDSASPTGLGEVMASSSMTSNMEALNRSSLLKRGARHLQRSWTAPQSIPGEPLIIQCTAGGPRPVPLFHCALPLGCLWGLRS